MSILAIEYLENALKNIENAKKLSGNDTFYDFTILDMVAGQIQSAIQELENDGD